MAFYNYACLLAASGDESGAMEALRSAFGYDGTLREHAAGDPDLTPLRRRPDFAELVGPE